MSGQVDLLIHSPEGIKLTRQALEIIEQHAIWPTLLNIELFTHFVAEPTSDLGIEIQQILDAGDPLTEAVSRRLALEHFPEVRLSEQIRDTGNHLLEKLEDVSQEIHAVQATSDTYSDTLAEAGRRLTLAIEAPTVKILVATLAAATGQVQTQTKTLETRLQETVNEVNRLKRNLVAMQLAVNTDVLTNLANRKAFDEAMSAACAHADASGSILTLAVIDIDKFKAFNDTWGHQTGDQVIRFVAGTIKQFTMPHWLSARYGGEEFSILLPNETAANAELALNEIRREIATRKLRRRSSNDSLGPITVSAGIAQRHPNETSDAFIERADKALYVAKNTGRNKVVNCEDTVSHQVINLTEKIPSLPPRY